MAGRLFILSGASGSGKTTLLNAICESPSSGVQMAPKFSERPSRGPRDDIVHVDRIESPEFDIAYTLNEHRYGLKTKLIERVLDDGAVLFIVLSDFRVIRRLKAQFGDRAVALYVSSAIDPDKLLRIHGERHPFVPSAEQRKLLGTQFARLGSAARLESWPAVGDCMAELIEGWKEIIPESKSAEVRAQKIRLFHSRYIDSIDLFDHVILNYHAPEDMLKQAEAIVRYHQGDRIRPRPTGGSVLFMVAAASGAGKGILMENLNILGSDRVAVVRKMARRDPKPGDRRDGMIALGPNGEFPTDFDWRWHFHQGDHFDGTEYAISTSEIRRGIDEGQQQIVISNTGEIEVSRERLSGQVVWIYLHAVRSEEEVRAYQYANCATPEEANERLREIDAVHSTYIERICEFDHVLLNTTYPEDLYEQMERLSEYYRRRGDEPESYPNQEGALQLQRTSS